MNDCACILLASVPLGLTLITSWQNIINLQVPFTTILSIMASSTMDGPMAASRSKKEEETMAASAALVAWALHVGSMWSGGHPWPAMAPTVPPPVRHAFPDNCRHPVETYVAVHAPLQCCVGCWAAAPALLSVLFPQKIWSIRTHHRNAK